jgi:hypothetical protein
MIQIFACVTKFLGWLRFWLRMMDTELLNLSVLFDTKEEIFRGHATLINPSL